MTPTNGRRHAADAISEKGAAPATPIPNKRPRVGNAAAKQKAPSRRRRGETKGAELATTRRNKRRRIIDIDIDINYNCDIDHDINYNINYNCDIDYDIDYAINNDIDYDIDYNIDYDFD